jgi:CubicO group peptidase (beta-lactamase class C family)
VDTLVTMPNPDLEVIEGNKGRWTHATHRRRGWHNLFRIARYGISLRASRVMCLEKRADLRIAELAEVGHLISLPWFSAMLVIQGNKVLYERYAPDFGQDQPHSIQSITKTLMNLVIGNLVEQGVLDLDRRIEHYIPEIGSGYAKATLQQVLNMDVANDYSADFEDPAATYYSHEEAMGWRLPKDLDHEVTQHDFLRRIASADTRNLTGEVQYKDANADVLAWVAERVTGRGLRAFLVDIVDAAGLEGTFYITTDRQGVPAVDGGACLTARDLARYFSLFLRAGRGIGGETVGGAAFIARTLKSGVSMRAPYDGLRYSNHLMVSSRSLGHGGWGGQYVIANLDTGKIAVFFSVIENEHAITKDYLGPVIHALQSITSAD